MVSPGTAAHRLYFGSAVIPAATRTTGNPRIDWKFKALLGFHKLYSRILLGTARDRLFEERDSMGLRHRKHLLCRAARAILVSPAKQKDPLHNGWLCLVPALPGSIAATAG